MRPSTSSTGGANVLGVSLGRPGASDGWLVPMRTHSVTGSALGLSERSMRGVTGTGRFSRCVLAMAPTRPQAKTMGSHT